MFICADLNTDPFVIFLWKLTGSTERESERESEMGGGKNTPGGTGSFGNERVCAANFLIKERGPPALSVQIQ